MKDNNQNFIATWADTSLRLLLLKIAVLPNPHVGTAQTRYWLFQLSSPKYIQIGTLL